MGPILLHLPFRTLAALLPALAATNLTLMPSICATVYPDRHLARCVVAGVAKVLLRGVLLPLLVVYVAELRARRVFATATPAP